MNVRVRMAPSPTGLLHVGTARAALFNYLYARANDGVFILRFDDTDLARNEDYFEQDILESLRWLGLDWDEGVGGVGGPHGTYRQSDRLEHYRAKATELVESGAAYYDNRSPDELEALRQRAQKEGKHPGHYIRRPETPMAGGAIRLSIPQDEPVVFHDLIRDEVSFEPRDVDDFVILRSDGNPTYHLASTVDDIDYEITHVARGEDLLPSTPKHIVLTRALGASEPVYAHLPLLFGMDGKKLSKRHGAVSLSSYRDEGYLPEAMFNYLCLLGWSIDGETTLFTKDEAIAAFDLVDVSKNPAAFDVNKLAAINGEYVRAIPAGEFQELVRPHVEMAAKQNLSDDQWSKFVQISDLVQERTRLLPEAGEQVAFLFRDVDEYDERSWNKVILKDGVLEILTAAQQRLSGLEEWTSETIEETLRGMLADLEVGAGKAFQPIRVSVTGTTVSPPLFESLAALGKSATLTRISRVRGKLLAG